MKYLQLSLLSLLPLAALLVTGCSHTDSMPASSFAGLASGTEGPQAAPEQATAVEAFEQAARFDANEAHHRLSGVDLSKCREAGAPRGFGHAKVSYKPTGDIAKVVVDEPFALRPKAAKCVGDELATATVSGFSGDLVTIDTTWYVP